MRQHELDLKACDVPADIAGYAIQNALRTKRLGEFAKATIHRHDREKIKDKKQSWWREDLMFGCPVCAMARKWFRASASAAAGAAAFSTPSRAQAGPVVDFHTHMLDPELLRRFPSNLRPGVMEAGLGPEVHIERMQRLGIDCHVVGHAGGLQGISWGDVHEDLDIIRRVNDAIAQDWVARFPARFIGAFGLPTQDLSLALPELERMAQTPGMRVLQVSSHTPDKRYFGDPSLDPLMAALERHGIVLFIHPHLQNTRPPLDQFALNNSIGQGIEEATVMGNIIFQGVFEKFPRLKILIAHGGGFLPHYGGRMDRNAANNPSIARNLKDPPSAYLRRFWYDSCVYSSDVLARLVRAIGADRIVLGGDYPVGGPEPVAEIRAAEGVSAADVSTILSGNAARLLG